MSVLRFFHTYKDHYKKEISMSNMPYVTTRPLDQENPHYFVYEERPK